ncbi:MAG: ABC transporter substrate-binding protein [Spirochaetaceae bacterium]|nr:ABC transporter substrate-binding protein [Spirochaetaceae bacterium]
MKPYAFVSAIALAALLSSCGGGSAGKEIKIGGIGPVTGEAATYGVSTKQGMELAFEEWNAKGGVLGKQVKLVFADDKGDPAEGATVYTKLIQQDKVVAIVGTVMSKVTLAGAPIAQAAKIPMITPTSTNEKVTQTGDFIYRACYIDSFEGNVGAKFAFDDLKAKSAGIIFDVGNDYSKGLAENFKNTFEGFGGKIAANEGHPSGATDFKAQLTKIVQAKPDVLYVPDYYNDVALIAKQARELGYKGPMVGGDGWDSPELVKIGGAAVENGFFTNHYSAADSRPVVQDFVKKFTAKNGAAPDALATLAYDAVYIMLDAIKRAGKTDGAAIRDALAATDLGVVSGQVKFDANRNPVKSAVIIEIKGGAQVYKTTVNP